MASATDYFKKVGLPGNATTLAAPGHSISGTSFTVVSTSLWPTDTGVTFAIDTTTLVNGVTTRVPGSYTVWDGVVSSSTTITGAILRYGTDQNYPAGSTTRVYILPTSVRENKIVDGLIAAGITQAGGMGAITPTSIVSPSITGTAGVFTTLTVGSQTPSADWTASVAPNTVTYNGNRSYDLVFNATDLTGAINPGTRLRTTRTVSAPTQSTSLNGTTQYYSKSSPAGMTFTDDFVVGAWVKLSAYGTGGGTVIASRYNGTSGWTFKISAAGQVELDGFNASASNFNYVQSYQSIPLNKWVHVTAQLDMSAFTATTTTSYVMIDGVDVPALVNRGGTNPTALIQAGNLEIGSTNGGTLFFPGKIAQPFVTSAKVTQANIRTIYSQGITASDITALSIISAYSFNGVITDLNTTNANNLTANGSAVATNADSPFGTQASGLISATLDYGIVQASTFSTNTTLTVQVPEGCTIPTSGGVSAVSYSSAGKPYGFPSQTDRWQVASLSRTSLVVAGASQNVWYRGSNTDSWKLSIPVGSWNLSYTSPFYLERAASGVLGGNMTLSTTTSSETDSRFTTFFGVNPTGNISQQMYAISSVTLSTATTYNALMKTTQPSSTAIDMSNQIGVGLITAVNAYL